jgi:hypothetical protein
MTDAAKLAEFKERQRVTYVEESPNRGYSGVFLRYEEDEETGGNCVVRWEEIEGSRLAVPVEAREYAEALTLEVVTIGASRLRMLEMMKRTCRLKETLTLLGGARLEAGTLVEVVDVQDGLDGPVATFELPDAVRTPQWTRAQAAASLLEVLPEG